MGHRHGETVKLTLVSADASAGVPLVVSDENGKTRPIQPYEALWIDMLEVNSTASVAVTDPGATNNTALGTFSANTTDFHVPGEGISVSVGTTPVVTGVAATAVTLVGSGRIISGKSQGFRAGYKELLTPGGNVTGY